MAENASTSKAIRSALLERVSPEDEPSLHIGGVPYSELIREYGSPLYVYDAQILRGNFDLVRDAFGDRVEILYALKANPNIAIAQTLRTAGSGAYVA